MSSKQVHISGDNILKMCKQEVSWTKHNIKKNQKKENLDNNMIPKRSIKTLYTVIM